VADRRSARRQLGAAVRLTLIIPRIMAAQHHGTRGRQGPSEPGYVCDVCPRLADAKSDECREEPVSKDAFDPRQVPNCRVSNLHHPMNTWYRGDQGR
jgi:hypothetical protein